MTIAVSPAVSPQSASPFAYVSEGNSFFALFPHRFDYIYAEHPQPGQSPAWQTESRYPLSDRMALEGALLYGVRFAKQTQYCLLDIDRGSAYHPARDPLAIGRIQSALESLGLVSYLACTSSYSGGLHLYFPFQHPQKSWELGIAVSTLLECAGFKLAPGQLEVFPNPRPYISEGTLSLFNAHRLPMQAGSYLLDADFQPIWGDRDRFTHQWRSAQNRNEIDPKELKRLLRQCRQKHYRVSGKADKFISDLNAEIEPGWTGFGQTNRLLGRIALRAYVFQHVITGGQPLAGPALVEEIVRTARSLPGYSEWCRHQHEIEQRAEEWARCVESSHYFHYGSPSGKYKPGGTQAQDNLKDLDHSKPGWNQQQSEAARERIRGAIADLLNRDALPSGATARFRLLTQFGIGGSSLYRHRDLWHPNYLMSDCLISEYLEPVDNAPEDNPTAVLSGLSNAAPVENPPDPPTLLEQGEGDCVEDASPSPYLTSLLSAVGGNPLLVKLYSGLSDRFICSTGSNPVQSWADQPDDFSDLLVAISVQLRRLAWTPVQTRGELLACFGKSQQAMLSEQELVCWLEWLEGYP